jgi:hypothetical protein
VIEGGDCESPERTTTVSAIGANHPVWAPICPLCRAANRNAHSRWLAGVPVEGSAEPVGRSRRCSARRGAPTAGTSTPAMAGARGERTAHLKLGRFSRVDIPPFESDPPVRSGAGGPLSEASTWKIKSVVASTPHEST